MKRNNQNNLNLFEKEGLSIFERTRSVAKRKRESTRTTFMLSKHVHEQFREYANKAGLDIKDLLGEEIEYCITLFELNCKNSAVLPELYEFLCNLTQVEPKKKTYVLTKEALEILNERSEKYKVSRDKLLERFMTMGITTSRAYFNKVMEKHKELLEALQEIENKHFDTAWSIVHTLDDDDPIHMRFNNITNCLSKLIWDIEKEINTGEEINPTAYQ